MGRSLAADLAKIEKDVELWYTRHDEAASDAEKEAAWRRIVQLTEKAKGLRQRLEEQKGRNEPAKPLTRNQVKEYLAGIETLVAAAGDRGRALVRSLVEHHGLSARMLDGQNIKIAMALLPPGANGEPLKVETVVTISSDDEIDLWLRQENAKGRLCCCGCGQLIEVKRRHYWMGIPKLHGDCRHKAMAGKRASIAGEKYINGAALARKLGISRSTLSRWVKAGKLPKPVRGISDMLLFEQEVMISGTAAASDPEAGESLGRRREGVRGARRRVEKALTVEKRR